MAVARVGLAMTFRALRGLSPSFPRRRVRGSGSRRDLRLACAMKSTGIKKTCQPTLGLRWVRTVGHSLAVLSGILRAL